MEKWDTISRKSTIEEIHKNKPYWPPGFVLHGLVCKQLEVKVLRWCFSMWRNWNWLTLEKRITILFTIYFHFMSMCMFCLYVCLCSTCMQCSQRPEEDIGFFGTGFTHGWELPGAGKQNGSSVRAKSTLSHRTISPSTRTTILCHEISLKYEKLEC